MADTKISALAAASSLGDADELVLASAGANKKLTGANLKASIPGTELSYVERTTNMTISTTSEGSAQTIVTSAALVYNGSQRICVEFYAPAVKPGAGGGIYVQLWDIAVGSLGHIGYVESPAAAGIGVPILVRRYLTPSAGTRTYSICAYRFVSDAAIFAGVGGVNDKFLPAYIRITTA